MAKQKYKGYKGGVLSKEEKQYISNHSERFTPEQLSKAMSRPLAQIERYITANNLPTAPPEVVQKFEANEIEKTVIRHELMESERWKRLLQELMPDEVQYFQEEYVKLYAQFQNDVVASEEAQIFDAIKLDILKSRNLIERKRAREEIERLERQQAKFFKDKGQNSYEWSDEDRETAMAMEEQLNIQRSAESNKTVEFVKLQERYDKLTENMKGTRLQRFKDVEARKESFIGLIKALQDAEVVEFEGRQNGLLNLAGQKAHKKLGNLHQFANGEVDRPILNADTVEYNDLDERGNLLPPAPEVDPFDLE